MNRLREIVKAEIHEYRRKKYVALVVRITELKEALRGIDPYVHPYEWQEVANDLDRKQREGDKLIDKLGYRLPKEI